MATILVHFWGTSVPDKSWHVWMLLLVPPAVPAHLAGRRGGWKCGFYGGALIAVRSGPGSTPRMFFLHKYLHHLQENNHVLFVEGGGVISLFINKENK